MKRFCTLVLAVMLVLTCTAFIFGVSAFSSDYTAVISTSATGGKAYKGDEITVKITVNDIVSTGICSVGITLNFDTAVYEYVADSANVLLYPDFWEDTIGNEIPVKTSDIASGKIEYSPFDQTINAHPIKANGVLVLVAKFKVKAVATAPKATTFSCTELTGTDPSVNEVFGASTPVTVNVDNKRPSTPAKGVTPVLASHTDTSITLKEVAGYEYKLGPDGEWKTVTEFTGLNPYTDYTFYQRKAETDTNYASEVSDAAVLKTDKTTPAIPSAVTVESEDVPTYGSAANTASVTLLGETPSLTLSRTGAYEYRVSGGEWQDSNVFTGLTAGEQYAFYRRVKAGATWYASASSAVTTYTMAKIINIFTPAAPVAALDANGNEMIYANAITLEATAGYEYSMGGIDWQDEVEFKNLTKDTDYTFYQRVKATDSHTASNPSAGTVIRTLNVFTPDAPVFNDGSPVVVVSKKDSTSITLKVITDYDNAVQFGQKLVIEYSKDGETWQTSNVFKRLLPNKSYTFYVRYGAIENICYPSEASEGKTFRTVCEHKTTYIEVVKKATCKEAGESLTRCSVCGDVLTRNEIAVLAHTFGEWTVTSPATYDKAGTQTRTCTACGEVETKEVSILTCNHDKTTAKVVKAAECETAGTTEYYCDMCGKLVKTETVAALGHKAGEWTVVTEATETAEGKKVKKCTVCDKVVEEETIAKKVAETTTTESSGKDDGKKNNTGLIVGIIGGVAVLGIGAGVGISVVNKKKKEK